MANLADLVVRITAQTKQFDKAIQETKKKTEGIEGGIAKTTATIKNLVTGVGVAVLVTKIGEVANASIELASEAEEARAKFNTAFRGIEEQASVTAERLAETYGLARTESEKLLGDTGDLLKGFGASANEALGFSEEIQQLAVDLASYNNVVGGASRVSNILTKSVLGNKDGLSELGVSLLDVDIKQELVRTGQDKLTGQAGKLAKAQATFNLILQQTGDAQGDAIRTQESYANVTRRAEASVKDLTVELGRSLLPTATTVKFVFGDLVGELASYIRKINDVREAEKALEAGQATFEQRILLLQEQKKGIDATLQTQRTFAEAERRQYGEISPLIQQRLTQLEAQSAGIGRNIDQLRFQIKEEERLAEVERTNEEEREKARRKKEESDRLSQENYKATITLIGQVIDASKSDIEVIDEQIQALTELQTKTEEDNAKRLKAIEALQVKRDEIRDEERTKKEEEYAQRLQAEIDNNNAIYELEKANQQRIRAERQQTLNYSIDIASSLVALAGNIGQIEIQALEATSQARIDALDQAVLGEEEYARQKEAIEKDLALKAYDIQLKQFQAEKALAIIQAGINTALAVTALLATPPLAIAAGVAGAAQVAVIASQPDPPKPQLATGAVVKGTSRGTDVTVAERGSNELIISDDPRGKPLLRSFAREMVNEMGGSSRTITKQNIIVQIDKQTIFDIMNEGIESQTVRITTDNIQGGLSV